MLFIVHACSSNDYEDCVICTHIFASIAHVLICVKLTVFDVVVLLVGRL